MRTSRSRSPIQSPIQKHEKYTEGGPRILWQFDFRRSCKVRVVLGVLVSISCIFVFSSTICSRILLFFFMYFLFLLDFWFLLGLELCNPNTSKCNFVAYIQASCIHFFQWTINVRFSSLSNWVWLLDLSILNSVSGEMPWSDSISSVMF